MNVTSDLDSPIRPVGSATVTLTCTVELSPAVDVTVTVNTVWTGPDGFMVNRPAGRVGSTTAYTSTAMVSSFGRDQSGVYTCTATVSSTSSFFVSSSGSGTARVTVGECCCMLIILQVKWKPQICI